MIKVAFAGPASNLILALLGGIAFRSLKFIEVLNNYNLVQALYLFISINIALAIFNLIPIAPLDGSQIFGNLLSKKRPEIAWKLQIYGPKILFALIMIGIITPFSPLSLFITPFIKLFLYIFAGI
jgi:Zn-dependent protease